MSTLWQAYQDELARREALFFVPPAIDEDNKDVHTEHCCIYHGCKYGDYDCVVWRGYKPQSYPCETCHHGDEPFSISNPPHPRVTIVEIEARRAVMTFGQMIDEMDDMQ